MNLDGTVTILTGASSGIGRAIALDLAKRHGRIVTAARRPEPLGGKPPAIRNRPPCSTA